MANKTGVTATETRRIDHSALRSLCIRKNWYTKGNNEQYAELFAMLDDEPFNSKNLSTADIVSLAENIKEHSETEYDLESICFELSEISHTFFTLNE